MYNCRKTEKIIQVLYRPVCRIILDCIQVLYRLVCRITLDIYKGSMGGKARYLGKLNRIFIAFPFILSANLGGKRWVRDRGAFRKTQKGLASSQGYEKEKGKMWGNVRRKYINCLNIKEFKLSLQLITLLRLKMHPIPKKTTPPPLVNFRLHPSLIRTTHTDIFREMPTIVSRYATFLGMHPMINEWRKVLQEIMLFSRTLLSPQ